MDAGTEAAAASQVALDLAIPARKTLLAGGRRPQLVDPRVEALFDTNEARAVGRSQASQDADASRCVAGHLLLLTFRR